MKVYRFNRSSLVFCFVIGIFLLVNTNPVLAADFCVGTAAQLNAALTTAESNGEDDTIKVQQGTYNGNFIYTSTEAFNVIFEGGYAGGCASRVVDATNTVLDAVGSGPVLVFSTLEVYADFAVEGLTLQNGNVNNLGGGLYAATNGTVTLTNNTISVNRTGSTGGGVYISNSGTATLINNTISGNSALDGGGVYISNSGTATLINNTISGSRASNNGGGICISNSGTATLINNTISGNRARDGGGVYISNSGTAALTSNTISGNSANGYGGGIRIFSNSGTVILSNNTISGNSNSSTGGGIYFSSNSGTVTLSNNTISGNSANGYGGAVSLILSKDDIISNIYNNIFWNNSAGVQGGDLYIENDRDNNYFPSTVNLFNNDFDQSVDGIYIQIHFPIDPSNLNSEDPLFVDPVNGDYNLTEGSPCIDAGDSLAPELPTADKDGNPRIVGSYVDIGAYEYQGFVAPDAAFKAEPVFGIAPLNVQFTDQSSGSVETWEWNFGDGSPVSNEINPSHAYNEPGLYTVSLAVYSDSESDTETKEAFITVISSGAPDLTGKTKAFHSLDFGRNISLNVQVENLGSEKACGFKVELWLSGDGYNLDELVDERYVIGCVKGGNQGTSD